jgi:flagellar protein FliS
MYARNAINAYAQVGVQTTAMSASPHRLIVMLFDGARSAIASARFHMDAGDIPAKGNAISKAIDIIVNGLNAALNHEIGGDIAADLAALYDYMARRLMQANLRNDSALLAEVDGLLANIASAWAQIDDSTQQAEQQPAPQGN